MYMMKSIDQRLGMLLLMLGRRLIDAARVPYALDVRSISG